MGGDPDREKLEALSARIRQAQGADNRPAPEGGPASGGELAKAGRIGFDFLAAVLVCGGIGWACDRAFGTGPWLLLVMLVLGFMTGIVNVWKALAAKPAGKDKES